MIKPIDLFKPTDEDWRGSWTLQECSRGRANTRLVRVSFLGNITRYDPSRPPTWRTSVWGTDDLGMEYDSSSEEACWQVFLQVAALASVNRDLLTKLGFVSA